MPSPLKTVSSICRYQYDPLDRLANKEFLVGDDLQLFHDGLRLVTQVQKGRAYSLMHSGDQLLAQHEHRDGDLTASFFGTDTQGSVLSVLSLSQVKFYTYTPYGSLNPPGNVIVAFNGERRELETGHYLLGVGERAYNPVVRRFNSPDRLSPFGKGGLNTYTYCMGDPINWRDPTGNSILGFLKYVGDSLANLSAKVINTAPKGAASINRLPPEMIEYITVNLRGKDLANFASTSKRMSAVVSNQSRVLFKVELDRLPSTMKENQLGVIVLNGRRNGVLPVAARNKGFSKKTIAEESAQVRRLNVRANEINDVHNADIHNQRVQYELAEQAAVIRAQEGGNLPL
ncbi:RHS repeat-associated core domain-containing protein [Pseudomonas fontis]|uniref:RHS repeat-associated core domain-containing protein n=1 Tax=Pseudomonas fontis TaxID=2942633 RepID=A0ABT5NXI9_9PSED|nr:RHS repeat-associated core domain-containing protein [Pseudomonas fontis]MDD0975612.1 RHS repeat-associated core domain-containing protein [Pseudomonas fontis]MDD0992808.1 RHS repeat-associated core domain-containing protein [Pseudomonas fontis]